MSEQDFPKAQQPGNDDTAGNQPIESGQHESETPAEQTYPRAGYQTGEYRQVVTPSPIDRDPVDSQPVDSQPADSQPADSRPVDSEPSTGPLHTAQPVWQPRPSGALSAEAWSAPASPSATSAYPGAGGYGTGSYPVDPSGISQPTGQTGQHQTGQHQIGPGQTGQQSSAPNVWAAPGSPSAMASSPTQYAGYGQGYAGYGQSAGPTYGAPAGGSGSLATGLPVAGSSTDTLPRKRRKSPALLAAAVVVLLATAFGAGYLGSQVGSKTLTADSSLNQQATSPVVSDTQPVVSGSVEAVAAKLLPSVVSILSISSSEEAEGSGIILSKDGLVLTNNHVIAGATELTVKFNDGTTASAKVVGADATDDLAVIKVSGVSGLTVATLGSSANVKVGEQVVAVGSPLGLSATVTSGIVSALNRPVRTAAEQSQTQTQSSTTAQDTVLNAIQTDAAINPGNSGGALVNMTGAVIGINSAIASLSSGSSQSGSIGVGFAIPIDQAHRIAQEIINTGHANHAVLGASVEDAPDGNTANSAAAAQAGLSVGAKIAQVTNGGGAAAAGLATGDVITKVGNTVVGSADALIATIRSTEPSSKVTITYTRGSDTKTASVTLGTAVSN
ncbi:putative serine protease PepD [Nakamurella sp. UYEF19]|uniref:S1C family serine protease n=1 Tax=Nakamurella sp. UYEF19 TaxID=1756392 RepID=UPI003394DBCF